MNRLGLPVVVAVVDVVVVVVAVDVVVGGGGVVGVVVVGSTQPQLEQLISLRDVLIKGVLSIVGKGVLVRVC